MDHANVVARNDNKKFDLLISLQIFAGFQRGFLQKISHINGEK